MVFQSYDDVRRVLGDADTFTVSGDVLDCGQRRPLLPLQAEPADHPRLRAALETAFSPDAVARMEPLMRASANRLIDRFDGASSVDFNSAMARPYPVEVLVDLLELPHGDASRLRSFHDEILHLGPDVQDPSVVRRAVGSRVYSYFDAVVAERRGQVGADLVRLLLHGDGDDSHAALSPDEVVDVCYLLVLAGVDPVTRALAAAVATLASTDAGIGSVAGDPAALRRHVEEVLRWSAAVKVLTRAATADVCIAGSTLSSGDRVGVDLHRANRDPGYFADPDRFDPTRLPGRHISFGSGPHRCVGSHLARWEVRIVLEELHRRLPDIRLDPSDASHIRFDDIDPYEPLRLRLGRGPRQV